METKIDLSTQISNTDIDKCLFNASGCWCTTAEELDDLNNSSSGAIVSKSSTLLPRSGNSKPRFYLNDYGTINSMGVPNKGYKFYINYAKDVICKPFIQSIIPFCLEDMETMLYDINNSKDSLNNLVELNLSCPNIINKSIVAYDFEILDIYLDTLNQFQLPNLKIGIKLPPFSELHIFEKVSNLLLKYSNNINFITCINSLVNGLFVDTKTCKTQIHPKGGFGGIGGEYCRPIALANVNRFYNLVGNKLDIIGCGGVSEGKHVFEHILCGASAVQVGSQLVREGPLCFKRIIEEFKLIMQSNGYTNIHDFKGQLQTCSIDDHDFNL